MNATSASTRLAEPPIDPSGAEGRRQLRDELDKLPYQESESLVRTVTNWVLERLEGVAGGGSGLVAELLLLVLVAALVGLVLYAASRVTGGRSARRGSATDAVLLEGNVSAAEYRARARAADQRGEHSAALLDWFRAVARAADERALLGEEPAQTAHELVRELARFFPDEATALRHAGDTFDEVRYGERLVGAEASGAMRALDERLAHARPRHTSEPDRDQLVGPGRWAP